MNVVLSELKKTVIPTAQR